MATYRGPNVSVYQRFDTSAPAISVESLPSIDIGTSYEVYDNEKIGTHAGVVSTELPWTNITNSKVVFDDSVVDDKAYDFYPVAATTGTGYGDEPIAISVTSAHVEVGKDDTFTIPNTERKVGSSVARIPYYKHTTSVIVSTGNTKVVTIENGAVVTAGITRGQRVYLEHPNYGWRYVGVVESTPNTEGRINLSNAVPAETYLGIKIGVDYMNTDTVVEKKAGITTASVTSGVATLAFGTSQGFTTKVSVGDVIYLNTDDVETGWVEGIISTITDDSTIEATIDSGHIPIVDATTYNYYLVTKDNHNTPEAPNTIFDPSADFIAAKVKVGDLVKFKGTAIAGEQTASITNILDRNTLFFSTDTSTVGKDRNILNYKSVIIATGGSVAVTSYSVERLIGFSNNNNYTTATDGTITNTYIGTTTVDDGDTTNGETLTVATVTVLVLDSSGNTPRVGDLITIDTNSMNGANPAPTNSYSNKITGVIKGSSGGTGVNTYIKYVITLEKSEELVEGTDYYYWSWTPKQSHDIKVTFRAINPSEHMRAVRIGSINDITDSFGDISPYNELAFMLNATFALSGGRVCYGVNVDSSEDQGEQYNQALFDVASGIDVYSHAIGTTEPGVNAVLGSYVDAEADPYMGHERIAIAVYDEMDLLLIGAGDVTVSTDSITVTGFNLLEENVRKGDDIVITSGSGILAKEGIYKVTASPVTAATVEVAYVEGDKLADGTTGVATFYTGNPADQSIKIGANTYGNRRITTIFPGWFEAEYNGETKMFPPYFISATVAGLDGGQVVSQSFTNFSYSIPGLANIRLNTNTRFGKLQLDEIGAGGIDIMIQDAPITQVLKSRHDLTSNMDSIEFRERSITKQVDVVAKTHRAAIEPYVGRYNVTNQLLSFIRQVVAVTNDALVKDNIVQDISIVSIERDKEIKDKINIILNVTVFVAGNYYEITLNVKS